MKAGLLVLGQIRRRQGNESAEAAMGEPTEDSTKATVGRAAKDTAYVLMGKTGKDPA